MHVLYVYAAAVEAGSLPNDTDASVTSEFLATGVGKTAAACTLTQRLTADPRPDLVVSFGVCGAHQGGPQVGALCVVESECFADEGVRTEAGFRSLAELGLGDAGSFAMDARRTEEIAAMLGDIARERGSTVSSCSGNDTEARARARRTNTTIETMEGAALAHVCAEFDVPMVELRAVSNRTGDRDRAGWDLDTACANLQDAVRALLRGTWDA